MRVARDGSIIQEEPWQLTEEDQAELLLDVLEASEDTGMRKVNGKWVQCGDKELIEQGYSIFQMPKEGDDE